MKILVTGQDQFTYNRTQILLAGLRQSPGVEITFFPIVSRKNFDRNQFKELSLHHDIVYLPPFRHEDVKFIKSISAAPVVFDALISKYLTRTIDHGKWWTAWDKTRRDREAFRHSDVIVMDTQAHADYIQTRYQLDPAKVINVPVGVDTGCFLPMEKPESDVFLVGFYGGFIPLQGIEIIIQAAQLLLPHRSIQIELIGEGPEFARIKKLARKLQTDNVILPGWVPYNQLNFRMNRYDLTLGIFGKSLKADLVIPNKLYHYAALGKCTITKDTAAIQEVFSPDQNIVTCDGTPASLATSILEMYQKCERRESIAEQAHLLITEQYNQQRVARIFLEKVSKALKLTS